MQQIKCPSCGKEFTLDEAGYADILAQVRNHEFEDALAERLALAESNKQTEIELAKVQAAQKLEGELAEKQAEIERLKAEAKAEKTERELAVTKAVAKVEKERDEAKSEAEKLAYEKTISETNLKERYEAEIKIREDSIEKLKELKSQLSTKMLGETLELHCQNSFNQIRMAGFPKATFEKDNKVAQGTKGDYVFRDFTADGVEITSIMFEMKNEADETVKKQKNESFFDKLDKDRKKKGCEYAILVSTLEPESELYNQGIIDVSYRYEKMYVIRPQFFIPMITLIKNAALNSIDYKSELVRVQKENQDFTNFEASLEHTKSQINQRFTWAQDNFQKAIKEIDESINALQEVKRFLKISEGHMELMDSKAKNELTIEALTKNNPTMKAKFAELESGDVG